MAEITAPEVESLLASEWKYARDIHVDSTLRVDSEGATNAWVNWIALVPSDGGDLGEVPLSQYIKLRRREEDGALEIL